MEVTVNVNGVDQTHEIEGRLLLVHFLRDTVGLTGTHWGCDTSNCGTCVVWMDEEPVKSCTVLAAMAEGHRVRTVEDLEQDNVLDPVQQGVHSRTRLAVRFLYAWHVDDQPGPFLTAIRTPAKTRSARPSPDKSVAAPATR